MDNKLLVGAVHIIEWLEPGDRRTGFELYGEVEPLGIMSKPEVLVSFRQAARRTDVIESIQGIEAAFLATGRHPILHLETHAGLEGISAGGEQIEWRELMEYLIPLNRSTRLNLTVALSACEGLFGVKMLNPDRRAAAFRGLIGPNRQMRSDELAAGMQTFYRTIFSERNGDVALRAMNDSVSADNPPFDTISAETAFKLVYQNYLAERCAPEELSRRAATIAANVAARVKSEKGFGLFHAEIARLREASVRYLGAHVERFEEMRRQFFFIDLYPENDARFDFTIEDCWPKSDGGRGLS